MRPWSRIGVETTRSQLARARTSMLGWSLALAALSVLYTLFWPAFDGDTLETLTNELPPRLVEALGYEGIGTPEGWLTSTIYGLLGPILLLAFGIGFGARSMAGDEHEGLLGIELSQPVSRVEVAISRLVAGAVQLLVWSAALTAATRLTSWIVGMDVAMSQLLRGASALWLLTLPWLSISWAIASGTSRRDLAVGVTTMSAVLAYVFHVIGLATGYSTLGRVSPFHWYLESDLLNGGADGAVVLFAIAVTTAMAACGSAVFARRDISS